MRPLSVDQVRELLSGAAASAFIEAWARAEQESIETQEEIDELMSQILGADARAVAAEKLAAEAKATAERLQHRLARTSDSSPSGRFARLELSAHARAEKARAATALHDAAERRRRSVELNERIAGLLATREKQRAAREHLRAGAAGLSEYLGDSCLFFASAEQPGGAFVVPLQQLHLDNAELDAFVVHRLAPDARLEDAVAIRDEADSDADEAGEAAASDPFTPPVEEPGAKHKQRKKKEKS